MLADPEHRWGLAPFHYTREVYEEITTRVFAQLDARREGTGQSGGAGESGAGE